MRFLLLMRNSADKKNAGMRIQNLARAGEIGPDINRKNCGAEAKGLGGRGGTDFAISCRALSMLSQINGCKVTTARRGTLPRPTTLSFHSALV